MSITSTTSTVLPNAAMSARTPWAPVRPAVPLPVQLALSAVAVVLMAWLELWVMPDRLLPIGYGVPLALFLLFRDSRLLWPTAVAFALVSYLQIFVVVPHHNPNYPWIGKLWAAYALALVDLTAITVVVRILLRALERRDHAVAQLTASNEELAAREEEIARQNEELQSQTEELERQSEELRVTNEELARREKMLESLLSLSRSLTAELSRGETLDKICSTLGDLVNGPQTAAAIIERRGDRVHVVCHHGFGPSGGDHNDALVADEWPFKQSFASLVLDRNRTGFLEDVELRPDLHIPQPRDGSKLRAVLASPLRIGGRAVGSVEVYHTDRHAWTDEQITLVESLAAQTSVSLEAAELYERIEHERSRLRTVLQTLPIGVAIASADGSEVRFNAAGALMIGVPPEVPLSPAFLRSRYKLFRGSASTGDEYQLLSSALKGNEVVAEERELVFPNGRRLTLLTSCSPIRDSQGNITGAVAAMVDMTEQKDLQLELDRRRREAEEASERKTRFLAAVSHDIRTPANAISLLAELLQRSSGSPQMIEEIPDIARDLKSSALSLVHLVSDVLDLTRFDTGHVELVETEFPLGDLLVEECRQFVSAARDKGLLFSCEPPPRPIVVRADKVKLARVFSNIVANAVKFTETGGIKVEAIRASSGGVEIRIADTGPGIEPEYVDRIFDEYFQLRNPNRDSTRGTGLGLAISRRLIQAMGGDIRVESATGRGSTFAISLPPNAIVGA